MALFVVLVVGATWLVFPDKTRMIELYLQSGEIETAAMLLDEELQKHPRDIRLLLAAADLDVRLGRPGRAAESLRKVLTQRPDDAEVLRRLARLMEWSLQPREAALLYERLADVSPTPEEALRKLAAFERYAGDLQAEVDAILRLLERDQIIAEDSPRPYLRALAVTLNQLGDIREDSDDPLLNYLIQRLFILGEQYSAELEEGEQPELMEWATYALEYFVMAGRVLDGLDFAVRLDTAVDRPLFASLRLVTVLEWSSLYEKALKVLAVLEQKHPRDPDLLEAKAETGRRAGDLQAAENALRKLTEAAPGKPEHHHELAEVYADQGAFSKALEVLENIARVFGRTGKLLQRMFQVALTGGEQELLETAARQAEALSPEQWRELVRTNPEVARTRADILLALDRSEEAFPILMDLYRRDPEDKQLASRLVRVAGFTGKPELSLQAAQQALNRWPGDPDILRAAADAALALEDYDRAVDLLVRLLEQSPNREDADALLTAAGYSNRPSLVRRAARTVFRMFPKDAALLARAGLSASWCGDPRLAFGYYRRAALLNPSESNVGAMLETASFTGDSRLMAQALQTAFRLRPGDADLALRAARQLYNMDRPENGQAVMEQLQARRSLKPEELRQWADMALAAGRDEEAFRLFRRLHDRLPDDEAVTRQLAVLASWTGRYGLRADLLAGLSRSDPQNIQLAREAAQALSNAEEPGRAADILKRSLKYDENDPELLREYAEYAGFASRPNEVVDALSRLRRVAELTPQQSGTLAGALLDRGRPGQALEVLEPLAESGELNQPTGLLMVRALDAAGFGDRAAVLSRNLAERYAEDAQYVARLGAQALFGARPQDGLRLFQKVLQDQPHNPTALKGAGLALADLGRNTQARDRLQRYLDIRPDDPEARYRLAQVLDNLGRSGRARREYARALLELERDPDVEARP